MSGPYVHNSIMKQYLLLFATSLILLMPSPALGADEGLRAVILSLGLDTARCDQPAQTVVALDSIAAGTGPLAQVAAGASFILRGKESLGVSTLQVALDEANVNHPAFLAVSDFLVDKTRSADTSALAVSDALRAKADYITRVGIPQVDVYLTLARLELDNGHLQDAADYLDRARENCTAADSVATQEVAALYSRILHASLTGERNTSVWGIVWIGVVIIIAALAVIYVIKRNKTGITEEDAAPDSGPVPTAAPRAMLELALFAGEKFREFSVLVERKLATGQSKDLYNIVSGGKALGLFRGEFLEAFDQSFVKAYPDFGQRLNALFKEGCTLEFSGRLSPEERLAAMISLGNDSSGELAQVLGLSLNTVYTYRNRLKGRARDRGSFEENLKNLLGNG